MLLPNNTRSGRSSSRWHGRNNSCDEVCNMKTQLAEHLLCAALAAPACAATAAHAQEKPSDYPNKPVRIVVGIAPAGGLDLMTRLGAQKLSTRWNQTFIVDNRPGGGTVIAMDLVAQAPPDGYTILAASETLMMNGVLKRAPYDVRRAFVPIVQLTTQPYVLIVHPSVPVKSVKEFIAYAKDKPGTLNYGSQGPGTTGHIGMERLKLMAGIEIVHVPYKGAAPALMDLLAAQIQVAFASTSTIRPYINSGKVRPLAISSLQRSPLYPDLPTISEAGVPGFELHNTYSYYAPAGTPRAIIRAINAVVTEGMNAPDLVKSLAAEGTEVAVRATPEEFKARFDREYAELEKLISGVKITVN
jgi:tripartite-type tricarboxylate transporter receptor subunit TctC